MSYEQMNPGAQYAIYVFIFMVPFSIIMTILMFLRWKQRKTNPTKMMLAGFFFITVSIFALFLGYLQMYLTGYKMELYRITLAVAYTTLMIANLFLMLFAKDIFSIEMKYVRKYIIVNIIIAILVALPYNYYGVPSDEIPSFTIRPYTSVLLVLFSIFSYSKIAHASFSNSKKMEVSFAKIGFKLIGYSQISLVIFFSFLMLDTIWFTYIVKEGGFSIFYYFAWLMAAIFFITCYLGVIMPRWFKKQFTSLKNELE